MMPLAEQALAKIVRQYRRGEVTQDTAAKFIGMRKESFVELADGYRFLELMEDPHWWNYASRYLADAKWQHYVDRFNASFPECDARAVRCDPMAGRKDDNLLRGGDASPVTTYDADAAAHLPPAQPHLNTPGEIGNDWRTRSKIEAGNRDRSPASDPRVLPRDKGQPLFDATLDPELDLDVSQLDFTEAA